MTKGEASLRGAERRGNPCGGAITRSAGAGEERRDILKMGDKSLAFVRKAHEYAKSDPGRKRGKSAPEDKTESQ
jgi:hypothetical protein